MKLTTEQITHLQKALPSWAVKTHPTRVGMSTIHPMAVIDRMNEVFGLGAWQTHVHSERSYEWMQTTKKGDRKVYTATCHLSLEVPEFDIHLEQFGGSTNDDEGDALKGSATDALTKIASYIGIGAEIYKNNGNVDGGAKSNIVIGLNQKDWAKVRDDYANNNVITPEDWEKCSLEQKKIITEIKKTKK